MTPSWRWVTDGGLETDLIFHRGMELPEFAAYPLVRSEEGRSLLRSYYAEYAAIAAAAGAGLRLEAPTWRANPDWGARLGDDAQALRDANLAAIDLLHELADEWSDRVDAVTVVGMVGPRGDGYADGGSADPDLAAAYHAPQVAAFASAGVDEVSALTLTGTSEALGVMAAAGAEGTPAVISFTVETDGRLVDGTTLQDAVTTVDAVSPPAYFMVNCAHPSHVLAAVEPDGAWKERIRGLRSNASTLSHAELDESETLDEGDLDVLVSSHRTLERHLPALDVVGGCCGTDSRHVAALWSVSGAQRRGTKR